LALFVIIIYLLLPSFFNIFVSPKFNASYVYDSKDFRKKYPQKPSLNLKEIFQIDFNNTYGTYIISLGKSKEFINGIIKVRYNSKEYYNYDISKTSPKLLKLDTNTEGEGNDKLGAFKSIDASYRLEDEERYINLSIKNYYLQNFIVFELNIPEGLENAFSGKKSELITSFPSFINKSAKTKIFTYRSAIFCPPSRKINATSAPVLFYDDDLNCFGLSPLDGFLNTIISKDRKNRISCGIQGEIKEIPKNFSQKFILLSGKGINQTLECLGDILLKYHDTMRKSLYANVVTSYLGYWTDNGAYYYYKTEKGMNYEETLIAIK